MNEKADVSKVSPETMDLIKGIAEEEGFTNCKIETINEGMKGEGYLGTITSILIEDQDKANNRKPLKLVVKTASKSEALRKQAPIRPIYNREIHMYTMVFPTFHDLEMRKGLPPTIFAPKFYQAENSDKNETLILENLKTCGFKLYDRRKPMDEDHIRLVLGQYGRLHALSFALRDQNPKKFEEVVGSLDDVFLKFTKQANLLGSMIHRCVKSQSVLDVNKDEEALKVYQRFIEEIPLFFEELGRSVDEYSVALHGDCWTNNMMFRYQDTNGTTKVSDVRLLDFQLSRLGPPVFDLVYFLYSCSSKEIMGKLNDYLKLYHASLSSHLQQLGTSPEKAYPYRVLLEQWKKYAKYGLVMSLIVIHVMLSEKEEAVNLADFAESGKRLERAFNYKLAKTEEYNERIKNVILHFVENGFI